MEYEEAQIIELLACELADKVETIGRLLKEIEPKELENNTNLSSCLINAHCVNFDERYCIGDYFKQKGCYAN